MLYSEILPSTALVMSVLSFGLSVKTHLRDRSRLKISAQFIAQSELGPGGLCVKVANAGRRPAVLMAVCGTSGRGRSSCTYLNGQQGVRLGENERYEVRLSKEDVFHTAVADDDQDYRFVDLWVEDSLGHRHSVPHAPRLLKRLWVGDVATQP